VKGYEVRNQIDMSASQQYTIKTTTAAASDSGEDKQPVAYASTRPAQADSNPRRAASSALGFFLWITIVVAIIIIGFVVASSLIGFETILQAFTYA
jgi:hypothetical protein